MAKYDTKLREEELKLKVGRDWFGAFDTTKIVGNIDFCVAIPATELGLYEATPAMWAEAKAGARKDIIESFVQLILTVGRSKVNQSERPPFFLGAFDAARIAFLPYDAVMDVFTQNDFNWNVTPSDHATKEFKQLYDLVKSTVEAKSLLFDYETDEAELRRFVRENFKTGTRDVSRIQITRNNFTHVYQKWRTEVMPSLDVGNWDGLRKSGIIDADFFLADILSENNKTLRKKLFVLLQSDIYEVKYGRADNGLELISRIGFTDGQKAHARFWNRYTRPPKKEYWDFIVERRDLLVDQDVRERKGAFFTPRQWVELSQEYLAKELGENWQDDHYVWDCCGGTGNLEAGLTNKYNVWVSTLDKADVDVMHTRIKMMNEQVACANGAAGVRALPGGRANTPGSPDEIGGANGAAGVRALPNGRANTPGSPDEIGGANLLDSHVFQFDFLNDSFDKLPQGLKEIIDDPEKRKRLVIYINPPYAEGDNRVGRGRTISEENYVTRKYGAEIGYGKRELYCQFLARIFKEINGCTLGEFSKLKLLQAPKFNEMRAMFSAELSRLFIVPAYTFDNVKGDFPIGFKVWRTDEKRITQGWPDADVYGNDGQYVGTKGILLYDGDKVINDWVATFGTNDTDEKSLGTLLAVASDFQHQNTVNLCQPNKPWNHQFQWQVTASNVLESCVYLSVRLCIEASWLNDRDQFLFPKDGWRDDAEFVSDCLAYALFHGQNRISSADGVNHWIPYAEGEVGAKDCFASHFMADYIAGRANTPGSPQSNIQCELALGDDCGAAGVRALPNGPIVFSPTARAVLDAGRELWRYYHAQANANPNASYYDIRAHFQGRKPNGTMNATSDDAKYNELLDALKAAHKRLAAQIAPKVYAYGFLRA